MPTDTARRTALWVVPVSDLAGVARHALDVVRVGLPGWHLVVLCPPGPLAGAVAEAGGEVVIAPFGPEAGFRASVSALTTAIRALRPQVVHSHLSYADIVAAAVAPRRAVNLVTTEHGIAANDDVYHRSRAQAHLMARVHALRLRRFDRVIAVSRATQEAMRQKWHPRQDITVIRNGVDTPADPSPPKEGLRILSLARLAPEKRIDDLVSSFAHISRDHPDASLTLAGVGPLERQLRAQVARLGLVDQVTFAGHTDARPMLANADVVAQLSVWENCSYTLLDAVAHNLGVAASAVGGNPEILPAHCLVDPADHPSVAARIVAQGQDLTVRPRLASEWPTTTTMAALVACLYDEAVG